MLSAIIVAAGSSERMGFDKLFALVSGKPVIAHTIAAFERTACVDEIILVGRADSLGELRKIIGQPTKVKEIIAGGAERSDSVRAGLDHVNPKSDFIAVHDAARPMVTPEKITRVLEVCRTSGGAAALAEPINDTLKRAMPILPSRNQSTATVFTPCKRRRFSRAIYSKKLTVFSRKRISR